MLSVVSVCFNRENNSQQHPVPSLVTMTTPNQQHPFPSCKKLNRYSKKLNPYSRYLVQQDKLYLFRLQNSGVICSGFSQSYIKVKQSNSNKRWAKYLKSSHSCDYWSHAMEKHRNVSDTVHGHNFSLRGQIICLILRHSAITATQVVQVGQGEASPLPVLLSLSQLQPRNLLRTEECVQQLHMQRRLQL